MTEKEKMAAGYLYDANYDPALLKERLRCQQLCFQLNQTAPIQAERQMALLQEILGDLPENLVIVTPFWCDYGYNIHFGHNFYANHNCIILDEAPVVFGDNVFVAPNCCFSTAGHPLDHAQRNRGLEIALPITVGNNVWIGAGVNILPGVTIGDGCVIGAGSVITRDIPANTLAAGTPCHVIREITEADRGKYPVFPENHPEM